MPPHFGAALRLGQAQRFDFQNVVFFTARQLIKAAAIAESVPDIDHSDGYNI